MKKEREIFSAVENGDAAAVKHLIEAGAEVDARNKWDRTPLHTACLYLEPDIVKLLLEGGADSNARDKWGNTPLHWACSGGRIDIVRLLLDHGADVSVQNERCETPLDLALDLKTDDPHREEIIDLYRQHGPKVVMEAWCTQAPGGMG